MVLCLKPTLRKDCPWVPQTQHSHRPANKDFLLPWTSIWVAFTSGCLTAIRHWTCNIPTPPYHCCSSQSAFADSVSLQGLLFTAFSENINCTDILASMLARGWFCWDSKVEDFFLSHNPQVPYLSILPQFNFSKIQNVMILMGRVASGERDRQLRLRSALAEDWSPVPNSHTRQLTTACKLLLLGSNTFLWPLWAPALISI